MKTKVLLASLLLSSSANAWNIENVAALDPDFLIKGNLGSDSQGLTSSFTIALETNLCNRYKHCFNPFLVNINNENGSNTGLGLDYVYKFKKSRSYAQPYDVPGDNFFMMLGGVLFHEPLNHIDGTYGNFHAGVGYEMNKFIVSLDAYGSPWTSRDAAKSEVLVNVGYRF